LSRYPEFDTESVTTQPFAERVSKVSVKDFAQPPVVGRTVSEFISSLPNILAGAEILEIARAIIDACHNNRAVVASLGGHVVKTGISPVIIDLMERGYLTAIAVNGAVAIHDVEIALFGATSEDVVSGLQSGTFGMASETAAFYNDTISVGAAANLGIGESLGKKLLEQSSPYNQYSLLAAAYRLNIPLTVHVAIGTDIVHTHPNASGSALGEGSLRDFRILTQQMNSLTNGGVLLNLGSAVVLPEVLLKAIALLRNRHRQAFTDFLGVNFDFIQHYRSNQQVVSRVRAIGGRGIALTGHHEIMIPLLAQAIVDLGVAHAASARTPDQKC
jgi:deoxyhypusine synthase